MLIHTAIVRVMRGIGKMGNYDKINQECYMMEGELKMDHKVWSILLKDRYTEDGIKKMEQIYDFIEVLVNKIGLLPMKELFNDWNEHSNETFWILDKLVNPEE